jgi:glycerol-3-phosphate dehydrogenase (NAD(P)+)
MAAPIAIIGAGGWGTALAITMARADRAVRLWAYEESLVPTISTTHENPLYLPGYRIPQSVTVTSDTAQAVDGAEIVIIAVPSHLFRTVVDQLAPSVHRDMIFVSAAKGIEIGSLMRMSEVVIDVIGSRFAPNVAVLSGPTFAPEVAAGEPTALVTASISENVRFLVQQELSTPRFRLYTNADIVGVEIGAAVKNIIAIAAGVVEGLGLGSNTTAALVSRGLAEITRLAVACGGRRETLAGLAGLGDLVLTAYGKLSRNRQVGIALGQGRSIEQITSNMTMVAEGVKTARSTVALARHLGVEMPIVAKIYGVLYEGLKPQDAINDLMERKLREE